MLYRDEVYNLQSPQKGVSEVIIAKHRNGEIGTFNLTFKGEITKFMNYQDPAYVEGVLR
jgi:replicative DNA helicase